MYTQTTQQPDNGALCPSIEDLGPRFHLYTDEFAQDPHGAYARMRARGKSVVPVALAPDIPATLVIGYDTGLQVLHDPVRFPADPRRWQERIPADHPILPMTGWRPNPLRSAGIEHGVYRTALVDALEAIDLHAVRAVTAQAAEPLINRFCHRGKAELLSEYVLPLVLTVHSEKILGCPPELGARILPAVAAMFETVGTDTVEADLFEALGELLASKQVVPPTDVTARLVHNATNLTPEKKHHQMVTLYSAGIEPMRALMANTTLLVLTEPDYQPDGQGFTPPMRDAVAHTLHTDPPMANYALSYPRSRTLLDGVWLPADQPVLISFTACNGDPSKNNGTRPSGVGWGLEFSAGPHACPKKARSASTLIVEEAVSYLFDALPDMALAVPRDALVWRSGPFQRALKELPVVFSPAPSLPTAARR
ncbi:cytochrome P450 [Nocardia carnea]|uniref:cytochrome P450 n=1 Tax=Nocardia carnea TaxID=37328 RepID=UPI002455661E|nr:cytochrome P450 [Nocardia carnea]